MNDMSRYAAVVVGIAALVLCWGCTESPSAAAKAEEGATLRVYVPCGMIGPFYNIRGLFEEAHPGTRLDLTFDRADALTERIVKEGERPDIHLSIGEVEAAQLAREGLVAPGDSHAFGRFDLALCIHRSKADVIRSVADLIKDDVKIILLTPPENSSVGFYARKALRHMGYWDKLESRISYRPTIKDCYKELSAGKADAGFAYIGCPIPVDPDKAAFSKVMAVETIPARTYGGATVFASILTTSSHPELAKLLVEFIRGPEALKCLAGIGLRPVSDPAAGADPNER